MKKILACMFAIILVMPLGVSASSHFQPEPEPDQDLALLGVAVPDDEISKYSSNTIVRLGVNFYMNPYFSVNGNIFKTKDSCCTKDVINLNDFAISGEFFSKGGPTDSPPILFVNSLDSVKNDIDSGTYSAETYRFNLCSWQICREADSGPNRCVIDGTVICEKNCNIADSAGLHALGNDQYSVTGSSVSFSVNCVPKCILFVDRKEEYYVPERSISRGNEQCSTTLQRAYGYMDISSNWIAANSRTPYSYAKPQDTTPAFQPLESDFTFDVKALADGPELETEFFVPKSVALGEDFFLRAKVTNTGGQKAYIRDVDLGEVQGNVFYMPRELEPGESDDVIVKVTPTTTGGITLGMDYEAENLGCLTTRHEQQSFSTDNFIERGEACSFDSDCPGGSCCAGVCRSGSGVCDDIDGDGVLDLWIAN